MRYRHGSWIILTVVLVVAAVALLGCPKRPEIGEKAPAGIGPAAGPPTPPPPTPGPTMGPGEQVTKPPEVRAEPVKPSGPMESPLKDIFFDFDKSDIREDQKPDLAADIAWLKANSAAKITIEGHCDERGTAEYNLALGERRAKAARDFLVAAGIDAARISTISYGKERPFVLGHDESAWKWNRRGHFVILGK